MTGVLVKRENLDRDIQREKTMWGIREEHHVEMKAEMEQCFRKPRKGKDYPQTARS